MVINGCVSSMWHGGGGCVSSMWHRKMSNVQRFVVDYVKVLSKFVYIWWRKFHEVLTCEETGREWYKTFGEIPTPRSTVLPPSSKRLECVSIFYIGKTFYLVEIWKQLNKAGLVQNSSSPFLDDRKSNYTEQTVSHPV